MFDLETLTVELFQLIVMRKAQGKTWGEIAYIAPLLQLLGPEYLKKSQDLALNIRDRPDYLTVHREPGSGGPAVRTGFCPGRGRKYCSPADRDHH